MVAATLWGLSPIYSKFVNVASGPDLGLLEQFAVRCEEHSNGVPTDSAVRSGLSGGQVPAHRSTQCTARQVADMVQDKGRLIALSG
jgi:hypothetical protein